MDGWKQNLYRGSSKNEQKQQQQCEAVFVLITPGDVYGFFKKYGHAPDISGNINKKTGAAEIFILLRNGKDQTEFWRKHSQKHVDNRWKEQVKNVFIIFWAKNKCKRNGNKWRKRKAEHIKNHMRETKRGNRLSENRGSDFCKNDKYRAKNGNRKKLLHFTVQKVVSADNKS